jgi:hypothetical protein
MLLSSLQEAAATAATFALSSESNRPAPVKYDTEIDDNGEFTDDININD